MFRVGNKHSWAQTEEVEEESVEKRIRFEITQATGYRLLPTGYRVQATGYRL
jgi:hypothetical protein